MMFALKEVLEEFVPGSLSASSFIKPFVTSGRWHE